MWGSIKKLNILLKTFRINNSIESYLEYKKISAKSKKLFKERSNMEQVLLLMTTV